MSRQRLLEDAPTKLQVEIKSLMAEIQSLGAFFGYVVTAHAPPALCPAASHPSNYLSMCPCSYDRRSGQQGSRLLTSGICPEESKVGTESELSMTVRRLEKDKLELMKAKSTLEEVCYPCSQPARAGARADVGFLPGPPAM